MSHKPQYTEPVHEHIDEWHHHTVAEGSPQVEHGAKPNMFLLFIAFVGSLGFVGATILATYLYFGAHIRTLRAERVESTVLGADYRKYQSDISGKLQRGNEWLNDDAARAGRVTIPIDKARESVIARYSGKK